MVTRPFAERVCPSQTISVMFRFCRFAQNHSALVYKAAKMPTRALFDECMEEIKTHYPSNYEFLMSKEVKKWTHHASRKNLVVLDTVTSNNAESTIAMMGAEVNTEFFGIGKKCGGGRQDMLGLH